jgi:hypothetical protein
LVVAVVVLVVVQAAALGAALVVIVQVAVVVMDLERALSHASVVVVAEVVAHPILVQLAPLIHVLRALQIHVLLVLALLNQSPAANAETLAVTKNEAP